VFDNLDVSPKDGQLSFEEFKGATLIEPLILRCFMPPDNQNIENHDHNDSNHNNNNHNNSSVVISMLAAPKISPKSESDKVTPTAKETDSLLSKSEVVNSNCCYLL